MVSMTKTSEYNAVVEQQNYRIESLSDSIDVYRIRAAKMNAYLAAHGVPTEEIYDEQ